MSLPSYQDFYQAILKNAGAPQDADQYVVWVAKFFGLGDDDLSLRLPTGEGIIRNRVRWALFYLIKAHLLMKPKRGIYVITDKGKAFLVAHPKRFDNSDLMYVPEFLAFKNQSSPKDALVFESDNTQSELTPTDRLELASGEINQSLKSELIERVLSLSPTFFERLVVHLLSKMGYGSEGALAKAIGKTGDGGIDGIIHQDKLGLDVVYIQAKRYAQNNQVGRPDLQAFVGSLAGRQSYKGVFVTTSSYSKPALDYLKTIQTRIITIDGATLADLMIEYEVGTRVAHLYKVYKMDEDFFLD